MDLIMLSFLKNIIRTKMIFDLRDASSNKNQLYDKKY